MQRKLKRCQHGGKPGYRWDDTCPCRTYVAGDAKNRERAKARAIADGEKKRAKRNRKPNRRPNS